MKTKNPKILKLFTLAYLSFRFFFLSNCNCNWNTLYRATDLSLKTAIWTTYKILEEMDSATPRDESDCPCNWRNLFCTNGCPIQTKQQNYLVRFKQSCTSNKFVADSVQISTFFLSQFQFPSHLSTRRTSDNPSSFTANVSLFMPFIHDEFYVKRP